MIIKNYEIKKNFSLLFKHNLYLLYGENYGLKKDIKQFIKSELKKKDPNIEYLSIYENEIHDNEENFYNSIYSGSLFGNKKIILINDGTDKIINQIKDVSEKFPENIYLIIFSEILEKKSKLRNFFEKSDKIICVPCYLDSDRDMEIIASSELKNNNITLSRESINLLIEKSNNDRNNLRNELEKVKSFAFDKKKLDFDELKSIINFSGEYKSDNLVNNCLCGNIFLYKKILSEIYNNTINQIFILRVLSNKIQRLLKLKKQENKSNNLDDILNASKPPIFWKEKPMIKKQLSIWTLNNLEKLIFEINNTELLCKKNPQSSKAIFFNFITQLCKQASSYS